MAKTALRLYFMGFTEEMVAKYCLELVKQGEKQKLYTVADHALAHKAPGGKVTIESGTSSAVKGGVFGGGAVLIAGALLGPVGLGAVAAGAAIGAVTAAARDSGLKGKDIEGAAEFMVEGRWGLIIAIPLEEAPAFEAYRDDHIEFKSAIRTYEADLRPDQSFEQLLADYQASQQG